MRSSEGKWVIGFRPFHSAHTAYQLVRDGKGLSPAYIKDEKGEDKLFDSADAAKAAIKAEMKKQGAK